MLPSDARLGICETYSQMFLGSTLAQARHDLFRLPALALEIDDVATA